MKQLGKVFSDSLVILSRNFVLGYPFLLLLLILMMVMPEAGPPPLLASTSGETAGFPLLELAFYLGILLIGMAFMAGLFNMTYRAVRIYWEDKKRGEAGEAEEQEASEILWRPFGLMKEFFPGIGRYFVRFTIGGLVQFVFMALLAAAFFYYLEQTGGVPEVLGQLSRESTESEIVEAFTSLPVEDKVQLNRLAGFLLGAMLAYGLFWMLTMFWPAFVVMMEATAIRGYTNSLRQFTGDPLGVFGIGALFFVVTMVLSLLLSGSMVLVVLRQFLFIFVHLYFIIVTFVYLIYRYGLPSERDGEKEKDGMPAEAAE